MAISLFAAPILALSVQSSTFTLAPESAVCVCQPLDQGFTATDFLLFPPFSTLKEISTSRGVQHLWSTARNEAKTTDGKGSRTLDPVPADQHIDTNGPPCRCSLVSWFFLTILSHKQVFHRISQPLVSCSQPPIADLHLWKLCSTILFQLTFPPCGSSPSFSTWESR